MFFLLRAAFWLSLVILLIPADAPGKSESQNARSLSTFEAVGAAHSTWEDLRGFCGRNPSACDTGRVVVDTYSAKARAGARWVYEQLDDKDHRPTGSTPAQAPTTATPKPAHATEGLAVRLPQPRPLG